MKKFVKALLVAKLFFIFSVAPAQPWVRNLPQESPTGDDLTFFQIQKAFNDYWTPLDVKQGYYYADGKKIKAGGWKQFKRWEWFWNDRVDPKTGVFPKTSPYVEYGRYMQEHPVLKSTNGSTTGNWTSMGPTTTSGGYAGLGRVSCVGFSPSDNKIIYAGAASGGLWKSVDGGGSWNSMTDDNAVLGISDLVVLPGTSGDVIYAATGDRDAGDNYSVGVLKSTDGGSSWSVTGLNWSQSSLRLIYRLLGDPVNTNVLFAATSDGVYKTADAGSTWTKMVTNRFINIKFKPGNTQVLYGSTVSTGDIYISTDGGVTWTIVLNTAGTRVEIAVTPANPEIVYALISNQANGLLGIYKSITGGTSYTQVFGPTPNILAWNCDGSDAGGQGWYDLCLAADPNNPDVLFAGGVNTWKSTNGGTTWTVNNNWSGTCSGAVTNVHADKHYFAYQPVTNVLFECNDGGLYKTADSGASWIHLGSGLVISQMYRLGVSQTNSADIITGLQDNGTKAMLSNTWKDVIGGDGMECLIDYTNGNVQYGEVYYGAIYRTDNRWATSTLISGSITGTSEWVTPYVIDPINNNTLYAGYQDVWKSTDKGGTWTKISAWSSATLRSLAVAPSNPATIYAATGSVIYRTTTGGASWTNITGTLPVGSSNITYISVKQDDPNTLWVSLGQFNAYCVFLSSDGGATWTDISSGLPAIPVNCVIQNKQNTSQVELYAGTDLGVFIKLGSAGWVPYFTGLPNVVVMELEIYYASDPSMSKLRAATYGRGLWESDVYSGKVNTPPVIAADPIVEGSAAAGASYSATIADHATDADAGDVLVFSKVSGPTWLSLSGAGILSGTPSVSDVGLNSFVVRVDDGKGGSDQSNLQITVNAPAYCTSKGLSAASAWINSVAFNSVITTTGTNGGYKDNTSVTYAMTSGSLVSLVLTPGFSSASSNQNWSVWIDYNNDFDFNDAGEQVFTSALKKTAVSGSFTLPASVGTFRMRVSMSNASVPGPCDQFSVGEVEDYMVSITAPVVLVPVAAFSATPVNVQVGQSVQFTDLSQNIPTSWSWTFGDGKTSTLQNPAVTYATAGSYTVTLTAANSAGSNMKTMAAFITVTPVAVSYCTPTSISNSADYISSITFGTVTSNSGKGTSGYLNYSSPVFTFTAGKSVAVSLTPYKATNTEYWKIWIDFNGDGDFTDAGETVMDAQKKKAKFTGTIVIPATALGTTRMRVAMKTGSAVNPCDNNYAGEVEDYTITILKSGSIGFGSDDIADVPMPALNIYPNPATDRINISVENTEGSAFLQVFSVPGAQVDVIPVRSNLTEIDLSRYQKGMYYVVLQDKNQRIVKKFVKD